MLVLSPTAYADGKKGTQLYVNRMSRELPLCQITNQVLCSLHSSVSRLNRPWRKRWAAGRSFTPAAPLLSWHPRGSLHWMRRFPFLILTQGHAARSHAKGRPQSGSQADFLPPQAIRKCGHTAFGLVKREKIQYNTTVTR